MTLTTTPCQYKETIILNLDFIMYGLLKMGEKNYDLLECFFTEWLINSDYPMKKYQFNSLFESTCSQLSKDTIFFHTLITKYLYHDNFKINQAATELIDYFNLNKKNTINLDQSIIKSFNTDDIVYLCKKILGYIYNAEAMCSLIYSVLTAKPEDLDVKHIIYDAFVNYIGMDYPGTTLNFLNEKLSFEDIPEELKLILKNIIESIEAYQKKN